ncbi:MAG: hypothetical protein R3281_15595 [Balneolaceae bacterium]|nr:hypothetical protein [Balneolaceae bacterium]
MSWNILYKYVQGECTEEELRRLGEWLDEHPANEDFFASFVEEWDEDSTNEPDSDARLAWQQFQ